MPARGRPRLTASDYESRLQAYCRRHGVSPTAAGIPPFPSGRRETDQHREWLALYKAHSRLARATPQAPAPGGACGVCARVVEDGSGVGHRASLLHPDCHALVALVEPLGPAGLDRLREYLWPAPRPRRAARRSGPSA